ncbi:MAG: hypothetical protein HWN81_20400 [Candidatus Lokiarchaeota archaeon]|nr:hypothetical protein [Candidatus Lokiarchaeota archaeon]
MKTIDNRIWYGRMLMSLSDSRNTFYFYDGNVNEMGEFWYIDNVIGSWILYFSTNVLRCNYIFNDRFFWNVSDNCKGNWSVSSSVVLNLSNLFVCNAVCGNYIPLNNGSN